LLAGVGVMGVCRRVLQKGSWQLGVNDLLNKNGVINRHADCGTGHLTFVRTVYKQRSSVRHSEWRSEARAADRISQKIEKITLGGTKWQIPILVPNIF